MIEVGFSPAERAPLILVEFHYSFPWSRETAKKDNWILKVEQMQIVEYLHTNMCTYSIYAYLPPLGAEQLEKFSICMQIHESFSRELNPPQGQRKNMKSEIECCSCSAL